MKIIIKGVFDLVEVSLATRPFHVKINNEKVEELGKQMLSKKKISFPCNKEKDEYNQIQHITGWNAADIDTAIWCNRKLTNKPFHLTITTDY